MARSSTPPKHRAAGDPDRSVVRVAHAAPAHAIKGTVVATVYLFPEDTHTWCDQVSVYVEPHAARQFAAELLAAADKVETAAEADATGDVAA